MKVLIIGYGSIGRRHFSILSQLIGSDHIDIVSSQLLSHSRVFSSLAAVPSIAYYDYFIIASETHLHFEQLNYLCRHVKESIILVEKPLFDIMHRPPECSNHILTAYNMRFHPIIHKLNDLITNNRVYATHIYCGSYLPRWRPEQDYTEGYSADRNRGGGVLRDLSHELDYISHLFGPIAALETISSKISDLQISSDDIFAMIGITKQKIVINLSLDYISKLHRRKVLIHMQNKSIEADLINNTIETRSKDGSMELFSFPEADRNYTYIKMHEAILNNDFKHFCTLEEGLETTRLIDSVPLREEL
jgi:predicted dehydrogenase